MSPTFADLGVPDDLVSLLAQRGIHEPFPIQAATISDALAGHDICGRAPTGSGKTLAFGIPLVTSVGKARPHRPQALVLVPTRELADQVARELIPLARLRKRFVLAVYGGSGYGTQSSALRRGVSILVACPGRLEDLIARGDCDLSDVRTVVLDEADRMADMGFLPVVKRLLDQTRSDRQTLLFSATLDGDVDALIKRYQNSPRRHEVTMEETDQGDVTHHLWSVSREQRVTTTAQLVQRSWPAIVFTRTKHGADRLTRQLGAQGIEAVAIHGNRSQPQRDRALASFTSGKVQALVATDVAARGIHVDDVRLVVHFDPPGDEKDYVHRSGRTGRAGNDGRVVTMVLPETTKAVRAMARAADLDVQVSPVDKAMLGELTAPTRRSSSSHDNSSLRSDDAPTRTNGGPRRKPRATSGARTGGGGSRAAGGGSNARGSARSGTGERTGGAAARDHGGGSRSSAPGKRSRSGAGAGGGQGGGKGGGALGGRSRQRSRG